jgi:hypothetical protein
VIGCGDGGGGGDSEGRDERSVRPGAMYSGEWIRGGRQTGVHGGSRVKLVGRAGRRDGCWVGGV